MRLIHAAIIICLLGMNGFAQDPFKVAPQAYKPQFENDWVRIVRVHFDPHEKIASHDHPKRGTVYVYLKDGGEVRFSHTGTEPYALVRPPVKAGGFRLARAVAETHEVENLSDLPSDYLRVELKTDPGNDKSFRGRFPLDAHPPDKNFQRVAFENEQVRIVRLFCAAGQRCSVTEDLSLPALLIAYASTSLTSMPAGNQAAHLEIQAGQTIWMNSSKQERVESLSPIPVELLRIEFKTKPSSR